MLPSSHLHWSRRRLTVAAFVALAVTGTAAGAATVHRLTVQQATGSGGATAFLQTSPSGSALQGEVASMPNTSIAFPFGVLGEYNATGGSSFGLYVTNRSSQGFEVRELGQGRSAVAFDYRIVARPIGDRSVRFAAALTKTRTVGPNRAVFARDATFAKMRAHRRSLHGSPIRDLITGAKLKP